MTDIITMWSWNHRVNWKVRNRPQKPAYLYQQNVFQDNFQEITKATLARPWCLNVKIKTQHFLSCSRVCETWARTRLQICAPDTWCLKGWSPTRVFMAFVLPFPLGNWIKGFGNYELRHNTMYSEGPRREIDISELRVGGFPEDFNSLDV